MLHDMLFEQIFSARPRSTLAPIPTIRRADHARYGRRCRSRFTLRAFRSSNAVLALAGNVDPSSLDAVTDGGGPAGMDAPIDSTAALPSAAKAASERQSVDGLGYGLVGAADRRRKSVDRDGLPDGGLSVRDEGGIVSRALDASKSEAYVNGQFITLHDPGVLVVTIGGDGAKAAKQRVIDELAKLEAPLDASAFNAAREAFLYHLASDTQTPQEQADNLGWYAAEEQRNVRARRRSRQLRRKSARTRPGIRCRDRPSLFEKPRNGDPRRHHEGARILKLFAVLLAAIVAAPTAGYRRPDGAAPAARRREPGSDDGEQRRYDHLFANPIRTRRWSASK